MALQSVIGVVLAVGNLAFWWLGMTRWQDRFRRRCERRYGVTIALGHKSFWVVTGPGSRWRRFKIEMLQFVYILALFFVWAIALVLGVLAMGGFARAR